MVLSRMKQNRTGTCWNLVPRTDSYDPTNQKTYLRFIYKHVFDKYRGQTQVPVDQRILQSSYKSTCLFDAFTLYK